MLPYIDLSLGLLDIGLSPEIVCVGFPLSRFALCGRQVTCKMSVESSHFPDKLGRVNNSSARKRFNPDKLFMTEHLSGKR